MVGCPSSHQPTRIREETLESGGPLQREVEFPPPYLKFSECSNNNDVGNVLPHQAYPGGEDSAAQSQ